MAKEKPKEGVKAESNDQINLKVAGQDGSVVQFKIKRHTPLRKLIEAYCERQVSIHRSYFLLKLQCLSYIVQGTLESYAYGCYEKQPVMKKF
ncbi:Small ubiquitin-related modifier 2 [Myotis brandtii]|uniref:Small ubiquitin-related modifier 2 n=1 Tax=Myotis brandtii TaxID=109478 RepID=S7N9I2_MYOBR|nr:Small ubiquitin-related modifier 2 [Myotis brandtii]